MSPIAWVWLALVIVAGYRIWDWWYFRRRDFVGMTRAERWAIRQSWREFHDEPPTEAQMQDVAQSLPDRQAP